MQILPELSEEPVQKKVSPNEFTVNVNKIDYKIKPLYDYELVGMIVSYKQHDGNARLHKRWNDHLNVADYCVLWGETAVAKTLPKLNFWNGQFTCNFSTRDQQAWDNFNPSQLSNNHLVAADEYLRKKISKISIGDQIRIRGKLVEYQNLNTGGTRGTSITRDDTGDGACETIFVEQVQILKTYTSMWRWLMYVSLLVFILSLLLYLKAPHRSRDN
ncbi:MAG: hypothetical protein HKN88_10340 [Gammaproteobacteria bacterium]|nr:hypothetical protein [Gammaproteobacteria bacterium]NNM14762.1 hypothetical protein [Gammaproteobacteria bacterium]